jgi:hypothetical protein
MSRLTPRHRQEFELLPAYPSHERRGRHNLIYPSLDSIGRGRPKRLLCRFSALLRPRSVIPIPERIGRVSGASTRRGQNPEPTSFFRSVIPGRAEFPAQTSPNPSVLRGIKNSCLNSWIESRDARDAALTQSGAELVRRCLPSPDRH